MNSTTTTGKQALTIFEDQRKKGVMAMNQIGGLRLPWGEGVFCLATPVVNYRNEENAALVIDAS